MKLDRKVVRRGVLARHQDDHYVNTSIEERMAMVWPLTREIAALSSQHDVERRLQRHITRFVRAKL